MFTWTRWQATLWELITDSPQFSRRTQKEKDGVVLSSFDSNRIMLTERKEWVTFRWVEVQIKAMNTQGMHGYTWDECGDNGRRTVAREGHKMNQKMEGQIEFRRKDTGSSVHWSGTINVIASAPPRGPLLTRHWSMRRNRNMILMIWANTGVKKNISASGISCYLCTVTPKNGHCKEDGEGIIKECSLKRAGPGLCSFRSWGDGLWRRRSLICDWG